MSVSGRSAPGRRDRQSGFTLIEVLVAIVILVLGVLGAAAMTLTAIRDSKQSGLRSQATALAYELGDIMRANPPLYLRVAPYTLYVDTESVFKGAAPGAVPSCWTTGCTPLDNAKNEYYEWDRKLKGTNGLPNASAVICRDATLLNQFPACDNATASPLVVKLQWDEKNNNARDATAAQAVTTRFMSVTIQPF